MKAFKYTAVIAVILVTTLVGTLVTVLNARSTSNLCDQDCLLLLAVLDTVLDKALKADIHGLLLSNYMLKTCVNPDLRELHLTVYSSIQKYYSLVSEHEMLEQLNLLLTRLLNDFKKIKDYAERLHGCSHDKEASRALVTRIKLRAEQLLSRVERMVIISLQQVPVVIRPEKELYEPGEVISIVLYERGSLAWTPRPAVLLLPEMQILPLNYTINAMDGAVLINLEIPPATLIEAVRGSVPGPHIVSFLLALEAEDGLRAIRVVKARYGNPGVYISIPTSIKRGDPLLVHVHADDHYSAVLVVNRELLSNTSYSLKPGDNYIEISTVSGLTKIGLNTLKVCVNATFKTLSRCWEQPFYVEPRHPSIEVHVPTYVVTWTGRFSIALYSKERTELYCTISSGFESKSLSLKNGHFVDLHAGVLPVQVLSIKLVVFDPSGEFDELVLTYSVTAINPLSLFTFVLTITLIPALLGEHERIFVSILIRSLREVRTGGLSTIERLRKELVKPYVMLSSGIAKLYYRALEKIGLKLPAPFETLREHYYSTVSTCSLPGVAKALLWRLLVLAERDLYSSRKPEYRDAYSLYEDVLNVAVS